MTDEPSPIFPLPPADLGSCCGECKFWVRRLQQQIVMTPQGPVPVAAVRASGQLATGRKIVQAPCARFPQWIMQPAEGWCWEWKAAD